MSDQFVAEIRMFGGNFAPRGWAFCNGQLMPISQNTALFSLLGTFYGGNGMNTFGLPDLQGRMPMHYGWSQEGTERWLGESGGQASVTLTSNEIPAHTHAVKAANAVGNQTNPASNSWASVGRGRPAAYGSPANAQMGYQATSPMGSSMPHNNMSPYLCVTFIIALQGIFPQRG